ARAVDVPVAGCRIRIADGFHFLRPPVPSPIASTGMLNCQAALLAFMAIRSCELPQHYGRASTACSSQRRPAKRGKLGVHRWENRMPLHKISSMRRRLLLTPIGTGMVMALAPWLAAAQPGNAKMPIGIIGSGRDGDIAQEADRDGVGVTSQKYLSGARLVRAFNTMGYTIFAREANRPEPRL